jgi:hypothetical protein
MSGETVTLRERFAVECIRLADECEAGIAPPMIAYTLERKGERCALGWALYRLGLGNADAGKDALLAEFRARHEACANAWRAVANSNNYAASADRHRAVAGPLRVLAKELRAAAAEKAAP